MKYHSRKAPMPIIDTRLTVNTTREILEFSAPLASNVVSMTSVGLFIHDIMLRSSFET
jgi:hypothetical protein